MKIDTVEGTLTCNVNQTDTGKHLFDKVCSIFMLSNMILHNLV